MSNFMKRFAQKAGLSQVEARRIRDAFVFSVEEEVKDGHGFTIKGFGTFYRAHRAVRSYKNPKNGDMHITLAYSLLGFRASSANRWRNVGDIKKFAQVINSA